MKRWMLVAVSAMAALSWAAPAFPWSSGVHAYVADRVGKPGGDPNLNEVYGAMLPDVFNFIFAPPCDPAVLNLLTHDSSFPDLAARKNVGLDRYLATGMFTHNEIWGADHTAHRHGAAVGTESGYIIEKAATLKYLLENPPPGAVLPPPLSALGLPIPPAAEAMLYHSVAEYGADLLFKEMVPEVGFLVVEGASFCPAGSFSPILTDLWVDDLASCFGGDPGAAAAFITAAEESFRQMILQEGLILTLPAGEALDATAVRLAYIGMAYLGLPPNPALLAQFTELASAYLQVSMYLCSGDLMEEVDATVGFVAGNLKANGILK